MRKNRYPVIDGDGHITEQSKEILEYLGGNYRGSSKDETWADTFSPFPSLDGWARLSNLTHRVCATILIAIRGFPFWMNAGSKPRSSIPPQL